MSQKYIHCSWDILEPGSLIPRIPKSRVIGPNISEDDSTPNNMIYTVKKECLKQHFFKEPSKYEKHLVEDLTSNLFHEWNDKLEILTRICDYYSYTFRFYSDGRLVLQMMKANTRDDDSRWRGKDDCGHLEYPSIDAMLIDWLDELKKNEGSYKFEEEIKFIMDLQEGTKKVVDYDILKELEDIRIRMHNTNFDQDRIILSDAIELIKDREKYRTGMKVIYEGTDENDDILCPNCRTSVARMDDYEEMRPAHCPECGTKLIYGAENPTEKTDMEYLQELDSGIIKAELLSFLDDAVYDQNRPFKEQFVEFIKNDEI